MVVTSSKSCREKLEAASSISEFQRLRLGESRCLTTGLSKCKTRYGSACGHSHWSHRRKMEEGASADKLHFGVSEIATWRVKMPHNSIVIMPKCERSQPLITSAEDGGRS
jgi:hypothetical protein